MNWQEPLDLYCERMMPGAGVEPLNTATNLAFLVAAFLLWRRVSDKGGWEKLLIVLVAAIGVGSGLFHHLGVRWSIMADIIPIIIFQLFAVYLTLTRMMGWGKIAAILGVVAFIASGSGLEKVEILGQWLNGSQGYLPGLVILLIGAVYSYRFALPSAEAYAYAAGAFAWSLFFRSVDMRACADTAGIGTHFLWHVLNAVVLYYVVVGLNAIRRPS